MTSASPSPSTVTTCKADEKLRKIVMVGQCSHQILGAKLPSNRQILQVFFFNMRFVKLNARESARLAVDATLIFWQQARIPCRNTDKCITQLMRLYDDWQLFKKKINETMSAKLQEKYDSFVHDLDDLILLLSMLYKQCETRRINNF